MAAGHIAQTVSDLSLGNSFFERLGRRGQEFVCTLRNGSEHKGDGGVPIKALMDDAKVKTHHISVLDGAGSIRNPMDNLIVDRHTNRGRKGHRAIADGIPLEGRGGALFPNQFGGPAVNLTGRDTRAHLFSQLSQDLDHDPVGFAHEFNFVWRLEENHKPVAWAILYGPECGPVS